jgi:branched-chain amino acid transport system permease protein
MSNRALPRYIGTVAALVVLFALPSILRSDYWLHVCILITITSLMAVSLRALARTGQISMGAAGSMLAGGYCSALLAMNTGISVWLTIPLGGLFAAVLAALVSVPFLRAKGVYFAILTLMMAEVLRKVAWYWSGLTGGAAGLQNVPTVPSLKLPGLGAIDFTSISNYYYLTLVVVIVSAFILRRVESSWLGTMWKAINENDRLAQSSGIDIFRQKMLIFVLTAFFMGVAGALYAHYMRGLSPYGTPGSPFSFSASIYLIIYMMVGGQSYFVGPILGTVLLLFIPEVARSIQEYVPLLFGALLVFVVFVIPDGIMGLIGDLASRVARFAWKRRSEDEPALEREVAD